MKPNNNLKMKVAPEWHEHSFLLVSTLKGLCCGLTFRIFSRLNQWGFGTNREAAFCLWPNTTPPLSARKQSLLRIKPQTSDITPKQSRDPHLLSLNIRGQPRPHLWTDISPTTCFSITSPLLYHFPSSLSSAALPHAAIWRLILNCHHTLY